VATAVEISVAINTEPSPPLAGVPSGGDQTSQAILHGVAPAVVGRCVPAGATVDVPLGVDRLIGSGGHRSHCCSVAGTAPQLCPTYGSHGVKPVPGRHTTTSDAPGHDCWDDGGDSVAQPKGQQPPNRENGRAGGRTRTDDLTITNRLRYQLRHTGLADQASARRATVLASLPGSWQAERTMTPNKPSNPYRRRAEPDIRRSKSGTGLRHTGDHDPVVSLRGVVFVAVAVLIGALLLPSATRPFSAGRRTQNVAATVPGGVAGSAAASGSGAAEGQAAGSARSNSLSGSAGSTSPGVAATGSGSSGSAAGAGGSATAGLAPSAVAVLVANGSNVDGLAGSVTAALAAKGYRTLTAVNALTTVPSTLVYPVDSTGSSAAAAVLAALGLPASSIQTAADGPPPVSSATGADIVVVAGPDLASRYPPPAAGAPARG